MLAIENGGLGVIEDAGIDFIGEDDQIAVFDQARDLADVRLGDYAAGRILGRIEDQHFGAIRQAVAQTIQIENEIAVFDQRDRHRLRTEEANHGAVNGKAGIGIHHFIAGLEQREHGEEDDGFAAGDHANMLRAGLDASGARYVLGDGFA